MKCDCVAADGSDRGTCAKCGRQFMRVKGAPCEMVTFGDGVREMDYLDLSDREIDCLEAITRARWATFDGGAQIKATRPTPEGK